MKRYFGLLVVSMVLFTTAQLKAEEGDDNLIIHLQSGSFKGVGDKLDLPGSFNNKIGLGGEIMYQYFIKDELAFAGGICYQSGKLSTATTTNDRFQFGEISMPLILKRYMRMPDKRTFYYSGGICPGTSAGNKWEQTDTGATWEEVNKRFETNYSDDSFFLDLYADAGYYQPLGPMAGLTIAPYLRYRLKDNWFGNYRTNATFGLKIGIHLKFKQ